MNLENRIAAPSRSSGGKRLSIWFGRPEPRAHKYGRQPYYDYGEEDSEEWETEGEESEELDADGGSTEEDDEDSVK